MSNLRDFRNTEYGVESTGHIYVNTLCKKHRVEYYDIDDPEYAQLRLEICFDPKSGLIDYFNYMAEDEEGEEVLSEDDAWGDWTLKDAKKLVGRIPECRKYAARLRRELKITHIRQEFYNMSEMKEKLQKMIAEEGFDQYLVNSFEEAKNNNRKKNIVLLEDGIYLTFKADFDDKKNVFGELVCWVDDEFAEDPSVYTSCINAIIDLYTYSNEELNQHIVDDDLIEIFTPYDDNYDTV